MDICPNFKEKHVTWAKQSSQSFSPSILLYIWYCGVWDLSGQIRLCVTQPKSGVVVFRQKHSYCRMKFCSSFSLFVFNMLHILLVGCCRLLVDDSPVISLVVFTLYRYVFRFIVSCFLLCASAVNFCFVVFVRVVITYYGVRTWSIRSWVPTSTRICQNQPSKPCQKYPRIPQNPSKSPGIWRWRQQKNNKSKNWIRKIQKEFYLMTDIQYNINKDSRPHEKNQKYSS